MLLAADWCTVRHCACCGLKFSIITLSRMLTASPALLCSTTRRRRTYVAMIDQTTRGHQFLQDTFNYTPTVGWQAGPGLQT